VEIRCVYLEDPPSNNYELAKDVFEEFEAGGGMKNKEDEEN
jgi:hypothetical protein